MRDIIANIDKKYLLLQHLKLILMSSMIFISCCFTISVSAAAQPSEYLLKAAFLEKFARFTDWPKHHFDNTNEPFVISVIGKNPFQDSLEKLYAKGRIKNRAVKIRYIKKEDQIPGSHILFICKSEKKKLTRLIKFTKDYPILIISDTKGFAQEGSHINLYIRANGTLHFEINPEASRNAGLKIQVILLEIAKIIRN